jgi:hypothetical protein
MKGEIIYIITCDNYDGFPHLNFIISWKLDLLFLGLCNDEIDLRVKHVGKCTG